MTLRDGVYDNCPAVWPPEGYEYTRRRFHRWVRSLRRRPLFEPIRKKPEDS